jgi:hypothetical protein
MSYGQRDLARAGTFFQKLLAACGILAACGMLAACASADPYEETFDSPGEWRTGDDIDVEGEVRDGVYDLLLKGDELIIWTTAGEQFEDGIYQVEATQVEGPLDNGFGMLLRVDDKQDDFYLFEISGDGYVWIGRYLDGGDQEAQPLVGDGWIESAAVYRGLDVTNRLRVRAESGNLIFSVNGQEVGRFTDNSFARGDIGLMARTLGVGGVRVQFDNFTVTPLER